MNRQRIEAIEPVSNGQEVIAQAVDEVLARPMPLTEVEKEKLDLLQRLDRAVFEAHVAPIQAGYARLRAEVERRLGLTEGALSGEDGKPGTHIINATTMQVERRS